LFIFFLDFPIYNFCLFYFIVLPRSRYVHASNAVLDVKEQQQAIEQIQVVSHNLSKSVETPTSCDYSRLHNSNKFRISRFRPSGPARSPDSDRSRHMHQLQQTCELDFRTWHTDPLTTVFVVYHTVHPTLYVLLCLLTFGKWTFSLPFTTISDQCSDSYQYAHPSLPLHYLLSSFLVLGSPVPRLKKNCNWTRPRPQKTGPAVPVFHF